MPIEDGIPKRLFYYNAIYLGFYLSGPFAGGVLIYRNLKNLGQNDKAHWVLLISILMHLAVICLAFLVPEETPSTLFSLGVYLACWLIGSWISKRFFGKELEKIKDEGGKYRSNWESFGVAMATAGVTVAVVLVPLVFPATASLFLDPQLEKFNAQFSKNESEALLFYQYFETKNDKELSDFIIQTYIPLWQQNISLIQGYRETDAPEPEVLNDLEILEIYCEKRIEIGQTFLRSYKAGDDYFLDDMEFIHWEIDSLMVELEK